MRNNMNYKKMLIMASCAVVAAAVRAQVTIDIDAQQRGPEVSRMLRLPRNSRPN